MVPPYTEYYSPIKEISYQQTKRHKGDLMYIAKGKKPVWKSYILWNPTIWHFGKHKIIETVEWQDIARGSGVKRKDEYMKQRIFKAVKNFFVCNIVIMDIRP